MRSPGGRSNSMGSKARGRQSLRAAGAPQATAVARRKQEEVYERSEQLHLHLQQEQGKGAGQHSEQAGERREEKDRDQQEADAEQREGAEAGETQEG